MNRVKVLDAVRNRPLVVAGAAAMCLVLGLLVGLVRPPTYTATTQLYVQVRATDAAAVANVAEASAALAPAYSRVVSAGAVVVPVAQALGMSRADVVSSVSASPIPVSPVVRIRAKARTAPRAIALANLTADSLTKHVQTMNQGNGTEEALLRAFQRATRAYMAAHAAELRLQQAYAIRPTRALRSSLDRATAVAQTAQLKLDTTRSRYQAAENAPLPALTSLDRAESASSDRWSKLELLLFLGLVAGLAVGAGLATLLEVVSARVHTSDAIRETLGLELLARVPPPRKDRRGRDSLVMLKNPESLDAEAFRVLRMHLEFASLESGARTFVFLSALEDEGKTTTVCNLAVALALAGRRVVLVDGDVRQGAIAQALGLEGLPGLADVVERSHRHELADVIAHVGVTRGASAAGGDGAVGVVDVDVLPVGRLPKHPGEFAADPKVGRVLDELRVEYEFVLIDTPPLLVVGDAMAIARRSDAVIPIARLDYHSARDLNEFRRLLDAMPSEPIGLVLTGAAPRGARYPTYEPARFQTRESVG